MQIANSNVLQPRDHRDARLVFERETHQPGAENRSFFWSIELADDLRDSLKTFIRRNARIVSHPRGDARLQRNSLIRLEFSTIVHVLPCLREPVPLLQLRRDLEIGRSFRS